VGNSPTELGFYGFIRALFSVAPAIDGRAITFHERRRVSLTFTETAVGTGANATGGTTGGAEGGNNCAGVRPKYARMPRMLATKLSISRRDIPVAAGTCLGRVFFFRRFAISLLS
jgi:hypothetical protein